MTSWVSEITMLKYELRGIPERKKKPTLPNCIHMRLFDMEFE